MKSGNRISRRNVLKAMAAGSAVGITAPMVVSSKALGLDDTVAPSERLTLGAIGTGGMGRFDMNNFLGFDDVQVVAVCDVDDGHSAEAAKMVNGKYGNEDVMITRDFREVTGRDDIDLCLVATPDHWHAIAAITAMKSGKDVYCEKPLANTIGESGAVRDVSKETGRVLQCGSHERSNPKCRFACELVRNGYIGKLTNLEINLPTDENHHKRIMGFDAMPPVQDVPPELDYDTWLGHTAKVPYIPERVHFAWRFVLTYGGGEMTDRGAHVIDIGHLGADKDATGPTLIKAKGWNNDNGPYNVCMEYEFEAQYGDGLVLTGQSAGKRGVKFVGEDGWIFVAIHGGATEASDPKLLELDPETFDIKLGRSPSLGEHHRDHARNFVNCVKNGNTPMTTAEIGHRSATICHLLNLGMKIGRDIKWDPVKEQIVGDDEANAMLMPKMREPWAKYI